MRVSKTKTSTRIKVILLLAGLIFSLATPTLRAYAVETAQWINSGEIKFRNYTFTGPYNKSAIKGLQFDYSDLKYVVYSNSQNCYVKNINIQSVRWIIVEKGSTTGNANYVDNCYNPTYESSYQPNEALTIKLSGNSETALPSVSKITTGRITGKVIAKDWGGTPISKLNDQVFELSTEAGAKIATSKIGSCGTDYCYYSFDIADILSKDASKVFYEGNYVIAHNHSETGSCIDDDATDNLNTPTNACKFTFYSRLEFSLKASGTAGDGTITLDGNSDQEELDSPGDGDLVSTINQVNNPINIVETYSVISPLDKAISNAIRWIAKGIESSMMFVMGGINRLLDESAGIILGDTTGAEKSGLEGAWNNIKNVALSLLVLALIIIAFANVIQVDIEQYGLNRMIPKIIISIILSMGSWIIFEFFFDFAAALQGQAKGLTGAIDLIKGLEGINISVPATGSIMSNIGILVAVIVVLIGVIACGIVLMFTLLIRIVFLSFLLVVAPLAFIFNILPFTQGLTKQWWQEFFKWTFMGPVAMSIIAIGELIASSMATNITTGSISIEQNLLGREGIMIGMVVFAAALYMAATLPLSWGGKIMGSWSGVGKKLWGKTGGAAIGIGGSVLGAGMKRVKSVTTQPVRDAFGLWRDEVNRKIDTKTALRSNSLLYGMSGGRYGTSKAAMESKLLNAEVNTAGERAGVDSADKQRAFDRFSELRAKGLENSNEGRAWQRRMAKTNDIDMLFARKGFIQNNSWINERQLAEMKGIEYDPDNKEQQAMLKKELEAEQRDAMTRAGVNLVNDRGKDSVLASMVETGQVEAIVAAYNYSKGQDHNGNAIDNTRLGKVDSGAALGSFNGAMSSQLGKMVREKRAAVLKYIQAGKDLESWANPTDLMRSVHHPVSSNDKMNKQYDGNWERLGLTNPKTLAEMAQNTPVKADDSDGE